MLWWDQRLRSISRGKINLISNIMYRKFKHRPILILGSTLLRHLKNSKWRRRPLRQCLLQGEKKIRWAKVLSSSRDQFNRSIRWCRCLKVGTAHQETRQLLSTYCFQIKVTSSWVWESSNPDNLLEKWANKPMDRSRPWTVSIPLIVQENHNMYWRKIKLWGIVLKLLQIMLKHLYL